jgi:hypothetical protein
VWMVSGDALNASSWHAQQNRGSSWAQVSMTNFQFLTHWSNFLINYLSKLTAVTTLWNRRSSRIVDMSNKTKQNGLFGLCRFNRQKMYTFRKVILFNNNKFKFASCLGHQSYPLEIGIHFFSDWSFLEPYTSSSTQHKNFSKSMHTTVTFLYFLCYFLSIRFLLLPCPIAKVFRN